MALPNRPEWTTTAWWRRPVGTVYLATLVMSVGKGAWFTAWVMFLTRSVGLSPAQFGIGVTAAGVVGLFVGAPFGYLADRIGAREMIVVLGIVQGLALFSFAFLDDFLAIMVSTCVLTAGERSTPGIRIALLSGLTAGRERLTAIATTHVMTQAGIAVGAVGGAVVLVLDTRPGYLGLVTFCGAVSALAALLLLRVPHVDSLRDKKVERGVLVLRDRPFLLLAFLNGLLALNWGMLQPGISLWVEAHTAAPLWLMGPIMGGNAVVFVLFMNRVNRSGSTVTGAARLGLRSGIVLAVSCLIFATTYHGSGPWVQVVLLVAAAVHVVGEMFFVGSGYGVSVGLTPEDAHGEYQGVFLSGQTAAMMLAPGIMTALLVGMGIGGWLVLAALYLVGGLGTVAVSAWALRQREQPARAPVPALT
jgi:MFS family permease